MAFNENLHHSASLKNFFIYRTRKIKGEEINREKKNLFYEFFFAI